MPFPSWLEPHLPTLVPIVLRGLHTTWRVSMVGPGVATARRGQAVLAFWHGRQLGAAVLPWTLHPNADVHVMTSLSKDGRVQAKILRNLGLRTVDGSSSKRGARALIEMTRAVRDGGLAALACDGPTGPVYCAKSGPARVAQMAGAPLIPLGVRASSSWVVPRTWDAFEVPLPFAELTVTLGHPIWVEKGKVQLKQGTRRLQQSLAALNGTCPVRLGPPLEEHR